MKLLNLDSSHEQRVKGSLSKRNLKSSQSPLISQLPPKPHRRSALATMVSSRTANLFLAFPYAARGCALAHPMLMSSSLPLYALTSSSAHFLDERVLTHSGTKSAIMNQQRYSLYSTPEVT